MSRTAPAVGTPVVRAASRHVRVLAPSDPVRTNGTPVVFVHGIGMSPRSFRLVQQAAARYRPTVAITLPGFGGTRSPGQRFGPDGYADVVAAELRRRGITRADLVGQSMGTQVVVEVALRHPDLVRSLTLVGPVVDAARDTAVQQAIGLARDSLHERVRMNAVVLTDYFRSVRQYLHELRPMLRYPMLERVARVAVPVLVVRGDVDPIARSAWAQRVAAAAPLGRLLALPGPHHVQEAVPDALAAAVLALGEDAAAAPAASGPAGPRSRPGALDADPAAAEATP